MFEKEIQVNSALQMKVNFVVFIITGLSSAKHH